MQYDLITKTRLEKIERELERGDEVLIYTCSLDTEPYDVVRYNVKKKKIRYDILYYEGQFHKKDKWLYRTDTLLEANSVGFDSKLVHSSSNNIGCGFDLFIIKRHPRQGEEEYKYEGYYAVNYSTNSKECIHKSDCQCPCDPDNEKLFYRRLSTPLVGPIYELLRKRIPQKSRVTRFFDMLKAS